jgi:hypothetical protein
MQAGSHGESRVLGSTTSYGFTSRSWTFGSGPQRLPPSAPEPNSPGPVYLPSKDFHSTLPRRAMGVVPFGRQRRSVGGSGCTASNAPVWNPAPGAYEPSATARGAALDPGLSSPAFRFSQGKKMVCPQERPAALPLISKAHNREFMGALTPGV